MVGGMASGMASGMADRTLAKPVPQAMDPVVQWILSIGYHPLDDIR